MAIENLAPNAVGTVGSDDVGFTYAPGSSFWDALAAFGGQNARNTGSGQFDTPGSLYVSLEPEPADYGSFTQVEINIYVNFDNSDLSGSEDDEYYIRANLHDGTNSGTKAVVWQFSVDGVTNAWYTVVLTIPAAME
jgi:hypothetical protein